MLLFLPSILFAQAKTITGKIQDSDTKQPLQGVSVSVKGTGTATASNTTGSFSIVVPSNGAVLEFSYVGYATQEIKVGTQTSLSVSMGVSGKQLNEVVVVGYGTQKKSDVTGALTSISAKTIEERPVTNALQALQGKAAGLNVATNLRPGELPAVRIRGNRSLNASNDPLYVVDGIPIVSALGVTSFSMNDLNPNDIASIEILKDASATAIYGSRGSNGVILISTKKGSRGRVSVNYNTTVSLDSYKELTEWMNGGEYIDTWREALINGRQYNTNIAGNADLNKAPITWYPDPFLDRNQMGLSADQEALKSVWMGYEWEVYGVTPKMRATTAAEQAMGWPAQVPVYNAGKIRSYNWRDAVMRQGITQNHQLSLSTGSETSRLYLSLGYNNQLGVQRDQDFNRYNININGEITATKWLTLGSSIIASLATQNYGVTPPNTSNTGPKDLYSRAVEQLPYAQPRNANGDFIRNPGGNLNLWNPLIDIDQALNERRAASLMTNVFTEVKFTNWLKYRLNFGAQLRGLRNGAWTGPTATNHLTNRPSTAGYSRDENFSWVAENLLYIDKSFGKDHTLGVTLLQSAQKSRRENTAISVLGTINPLSLWYDLGANTTGRPSSYSTGFTENNLTSYMGRVNYSLMDKYLLTASGRFDGSSVLAAGHKWDFFPSFAIAWKMQEANFLRNIAFINELKPRFGYGVTGNSSVPPYTTSGPLSLNPYIFGTLPGIGYLPQLVQNPDLSWEKTAQWNLGVDFSVFKRRISGSVELYESTTTDLLYLKSLNPVSGYVQKYENIGKTRNAGFELTLSTINIDRKNFRWTTDLNFSTNTEEILELLNGKEDILAQRLFIGQPSQVFYHYDNAGIWQSSKEDMAEIAKFNANGHRFYPGMIKVVDQNGDYRINASDYIIRGSNRAKWIGGLTTSFKYKSLSLSSFIYARVGQTYFGGYPGLFGRVEKDRWSWDNPGGRWPLLITNAQVDNFTPAMQFNNGSFVTVRNISLTYDMPQNLLQKVRVKNLQLNVQVLNPFIFGGDLVEMGINPDDETNWDVQSQANSNTTSPLGGANNNTILPQSIVFGLRLGL
ncbi:MAG: TonB-dependent receptor plug [Segetibacter sp.]|nr:TonB-dependent receptor plug [Segetibacter sp.]